MNEREMLESTITKNLERIEEDTAAALEAAGDNDEVFEIVKTLYDTRRKLIRLRCDFLKEGIKQNETISGCQRRTYVLNERMFEKRIKPDRKG